MSESAPPRLRLVDASALVVASMIGTGLFTTSGFLVADLGGARPVLLTWVLGGFLALCGSLVYSELGAMFPRAGGEYVYLEKAYHPIVGFLSGWVSLFVGFSAPIAASAAAFGHYLNAYYPSVGVIPAAATVILAVTALHLSSLKWGGLIHTFLTLIKIVLLFVFIFAGFSSGQGDWTLLQEGPGWFEADFSAYAVSLIWVSFSYSGWNAAAYVAGEIEEPEKNLPRALLFGAGLVTVLYILVNVVFFYAVPASQLAGGEGGKPVVEVGHLAATVLHGPAAGGLLSLAISLALISSVSAMTMAGPRIYQVMAEDGYFFSIFARKNQANVPYASIVLQTAITLFLLFIAAFDQLLYYIGFTLGIFTALTVLASMILRKREPETPRPFRTPGWPVVPLLYIALSLWMVLNTLITRPWESLASGLTLLLGGVAFFVHQQRATSGP